MLLLKVSPKEKIQKIKVQNILSTMDTKYEFEYANEIYSTKPFYGAIIGAIWSMCINETNQAIVGIRDISLCDKRIFIIDNTMKFIDMCISGITAMLSLMYKKEGTHVWSFYLVCFPDIVQLILWKALYEFIYFVRYAIYPPYKEDIRNPKSDGDKIRNVIMCIIDGVIRNKMEVIGDELNRENCIVKRKRSSV